MIMIMISGRRLKVDKLEFNKPYLLAHFLSCISRRYELDKTGIEYAIAEALVSIRQIILSIHTSNLESNNTKDAERSYEDFRMISEYLLTFLRKEEKIEFSQDLILSYLDTLTEHDRTNLSKNQQQIIRFTVSWDKSRELDNFKNNKFSEN